MGSGGAEERRSGGAGEEERTDNFWIQSSRNPTQNFVHPGGSPDEKFSPPCMKIPLSVSPRPRVPASPRLSVSPRPRVPASPRLSASPRLCVPASPRPRVYFQIRR
ncbi:MAG: hypothetical protein F6K41_38225 [Symploca sp. SIO3E6]|nr:hypothetical protein [Caldora sp. SIO3E6]